MKENPSFHYSGKLEFTALGFCQFTFFFKSRYLPEKILKKTCRVGFMPAAGHAFQKVMFYDCMHFNLNFWFIDETNQQQVKVSEHLESSHLVSKLES